ncbi:MAG TPA: aminotransferase class V-fold PLP-dependent enzyme [Terriglobales bacterium]|nr:aminotransferase class V-fold PLP-dependent enzyme [Terriglobales bacterium]
MLDRRAFLFATAAAGATLATAPVWGEQCPVAPELPAPDLYEKNEEAYWRELRKQFLIPADEIYLNNGTVGSSPMPVIQAVLDGYHATEAMAQEDPEDYPIWGYGPFNEFRDPLAAFVGAKRDELALVRNATEANNFMIHGLDMKPGDEVLISNEEHPSGEEPWKLKAKRYGVVVKKFELPKPVNSAADVLNRIADAITPRTRVIFVSHITTVTGVVLPVKEICALARAKGLVSMIDGAHVPGMMRLNIGELGCDMYSSSPHKWLQAPKGSGFLYVREAMQERLWSTVTTAGWDEPALKAERFQRIGSSNVPSLWGFRAAIELAQKIGMDRIERRHRALADYVVAQMKRRPVESWTSSDPTLRCAITTFNLAPIQITELENAMWKHHRIRIRGGAPSKIRISTPYYLQKAEIDRFLDRLDDFRRSHA